MLCSFLRDVPRPQNKNVSACRNRPRRFRLPTVGTITVGCQGLERSGKQKIFQALRNLEKFLRPLTANCYCATAPAHGRGSSFSRPRRAVCNTFPSPQLLLEHISCVTSFSQGVKKTLDIRRRKRGEKKGKNRLAFWRDCQYNVLCNFMDTLAVIRLS